MLLFATARKLGLSAVGLSLMLIQGIATASDNALHQIITYGQSVSVGAGAVPALSVAPQPNSLMFNAGVRAQFGEGDAASNRSALVPLQESTYYWVGETPTAGTLQMINDLVAAEEGITPESSGVSYLGSAPGKGGQTIAALSFGSEYFERLIWDVYYGSANAKALGRPYQLTALTWGQGESDQYWGTDPEQYQQALETLRLQVQWVGSVVSNTQQTLPLIAYQVSSHIAAGSATPSIGLAQLQAGLSNPNIHLATPLYMMDFVDQYHLSNTSSKWLGAYYGLVYKRVVIDGQDWQPLHPTSATAYGRVIMTRFHVPAPPLVLDTEQVVDPGWYGFKLIEADGSENPISGIALGKSGEVLWLAGTHAITPGTRLRYAWDGGTQSGRLTGPRGNLRDSQGDHLIFDPDGIAKPMHNWCVIFEIPVNV